jgi:hypothetical protein
MGVDVAKLILIPAIVGALLVFASTIALVVLNWSEKTFAPVLSILLVGTATTLAAVLVSLKESTSESTFVTSVVFDKVDGAPAWIEFDPSSPKITSHLSESFRLGRPSIPVNGRAVSTIQKPTSAGERFAFCGELLQYQLLRTIEKLQRGGWEVRYSSGTSITTASKPVRLSRTQDYPGESFLSVVAVNRFSKSEIEQFAWKHGHLPLPPGTKVAFTHEASSLFTGHEKYVLRLKKPLFFLIDFVVEPIVTTGTGEPPTGWLPPGVRLAPDLAGRCQTYTFWITMRATFDRVTAGNSQTQEYKDWADGLFSRVRDELSD